MTGNKTFQDRAQFGTGEKFGTGLVRLPNTGAVKWRKADDSGEHGEALRELRRGHVGPSGTRKISLVIVNNAYAAYLAGPRR